MTALVIWLAIAALAATAVGYFVTLYNGLVALDKQTGQAWSNIDVLLKQRHDELPKLVSTVEGYMAHERETLERVIRARSGVADARGPGQTAEANSQLEAALSKLFALAENYPDLKADASFAHLQGRISELEDQISDRREFYNHATNRFNTRIEQLPDVFIARMLDYREREYFEASAREREDVEVRFSNVPGGPELG